LAAIAVPMLPPAPGRLSTITCCPMALVRRFATIRASASVDPPGGHGTIKRIVRLG
jgi:hypothetical protein